MLSSHNFSAEELQACAEKIKKRFGNDRTKKLYECIGSGDIRGAIVMVLQYYDRGYRHGLSLRDEDRVERLQLQGFDHRLVAKNLLAHQEEKEKIMSRSVSGNTHSQ